MRLLILFSSFVLVTLLPTSHGWCFDFLLNDQLKTRKSCGKAAENQSPINIDLDKTMNVQEKSLLSWINYDKKPNKMQINNNGYTVQLTAEWKNKKDLPYITGGPLKDDRYVFEQLHFHWGTSNAGGSEHTIDDESYSMEMHMVHWKTKYGSLLNATDYEDGILVVGALYNVSRKQSKPLRKILQSVPSISKSNSTVEIDTFTLGDLEIVDIKKNYAMYAGSLTGPRCFEVVMWIVGLSPYQISNDQMNQLRSIEMNDGAVQNNRETQPLNGRPIYYQSNEKHCRT